MVNESELAPDFAWSDLSSSQWKNPIIFRLFGLMYIFTPLLIGAIVVLFLSGFNLILYDDFNYDNSVLRGLVYVVVLGIVGGIISGTTISAAFSYIIITIGGLLIGAVFLLANSPYWYKLTLLAAIFSVSVASSVFLKLNPSKLSLKTNLLLLFIAVLIASIVIFIIYLFATGSHLLFDDYFSKDWQSQLIGTTLAVGLLLFWVTRSWYFSGIISVMSGSVIAILFSIPNTVDRLWYPFIGGAFNSFAFSLAFALPYLGAKYIFNVQTGIKSGLLGSCSIYLYFFISSNSDISIIPLAFVALLLGIYYQLWLNPIHSIKKLASQIAYLISMLKKDNPKQNLKKIKQLFHGISLELAVTTNTSNKDIVKIDSSEEQIVKKNDPTKEIDNPYITGVPLDIAYNQDLFVGRTDIVERLKLLLENKPSPPILLYGQRRIGKSSLLNFLPILLRGNFKSLRISMQGTIECSVNHGNFFYNIARALINKAKKQQINLPKVKREDFQDDPSTTFDEWLDDIEEVIKDNNIVLIFDEFESLEESFKKGNIDRNFVLSIFRDIIQTRLHFKMIFAGLHQLTVFPEWDDYFINAESVYLSYLEEHEARQLIEKSINLNYTEEAIEHVLYLTNRHPALLQLLCKEIILLKKSQTLYYRYDVQKSDVDKAIPEALKTGTNYFSHVTSRVLKEYLSPKEIGILRVLAEEIIINKATLLEQYEECDLLNLKQYGLIEQTPTNDYQFQIEMTRRWFIQNLRRDNAL